MCHTEMNILFIYWKRFCPSSLYNSNRVYQPINLENQIQQTNHRILFMSSHNNTLVWQNNTSNYSLATLQEKHLINQNHQQNAPLKRTVPCIFLMAWSATSSRLFHIIGGSILSALQLTFILPAFSQHYNSPSHYRNELCCRTWQLWRVDYMASQVC